MTDPRPLGIGLVVLGALGTAVAALADPLGIGEGEVFGWLQITGTILGAAVVVLGLVIAMEWVPFLARSDRAGATSPPQTTVGTGQRTERPTT
jgi:predicted MFS family arabinose efflux permease